MIDSGLEISKDLEEKRIPAFFDFTQDGTAQAAWPYDDFGHGTHVASLIASIAAITWLTVPWRMVTHSTSS